MRSLVLAVLLSVSFVVPTMGQTCAPKGDLVGGPCCVYDHIANGTPKSTECWKDIAGTYPTNADLVEDTLCGTYSSRRAFDFTYGDSLSQTFTVPSYMTGTDWTLFYRLTFIDPNNDGSWNRLKARVYDETAGTFIASHTHLGSDPDVTCASRSLSFTGNLAGHTLRVRFDGGRAYDNTIIRVRLISLLQSSEP
jgi:hypothetical protein